jgi:hypothetical protein
MHAAKRMIFGPDKSYRKKDPPLPDKTVLLERLPWHKALARGIPNVMGALSVGMAGVLSYPLFESLSLTALWTVSSALAGGILLTRSFQDRTGPCLYCGQPLGDDDHPLTASTVAITIQCPHCHEYSILQHSRLIPFQSPFPVIDHRFVSPAFPNAVWPDGCVFCGKTPVRVENILRGSGFAADLVSSESKKWRAGLRQVPYCARHSDAIRLQIDDGHPVLYWRSLRMMRRYLAVNKGESNHDG